ncbi:hypothetical protein [Candidatus Poriferisocius sp.]|uniref:hypothetical protein n=1 Tax=Candidatus Poriferisocius sp. TaxID=3101276 RepID=UPI003B01646D
MLGIVAVNGARLSAGSVGLSVARRWSEAGERVLFIDADATQPPLAERFGAAVRAEYPPESRGLPSLIAAHEPLTLKSAANHSYNLDGGGEGSRWALFGPRHPNGAQYAARWLGERASDLLDINRERRIVVALSLEAGAEAQHLLLKAMSVLVFVAPVRTRKEAEALRSLCELAGLVHEAPSTTAGQLVIDGEESELGDNEAMGITRLFVAGRLPAIDDEKLLRLQGSRKDRAFLREFDRISEYLLQLPGHGSDPAGEKAPSAPMNRPAYAEEEAEAADRAQQRQVAS